MHKVFRAGRMDPPESAFNRVVARNQLSGGGT